MFLHQKYFFCGIYFCGIWGYPKKLFLVEFTFAEFGVPNPWCKGVWKIAKPPKFGFSLSKQSSAEIFQMQLVYHRAGCASKSVPIDLKFWFQA